MDLMFLDFSKWSDGMTKGMTAMIIDKGTNTTSGSKQRMWLV